MEELKMWWKKGWVKNLIFLAVLGILFFTDAGEWIRVQITSITLSVPENEIANSDLHTRIHEFPFQLKTMSGEEFLLNEKKGRPLFINFWASWCVPCLAEFRSLQAFKAQFPDVEFLFVTAEDQQAFDAYLDKTSHELPFYRQLSRIPSELSHGAIPATYLISAEGEVLYQHIGAADWDDEKTISDFKSLLN